LQAFTNLGSFEKKVSKNIQTHTFEDRISGPPGFPEPWLGTVALDRYNTLRRYNTFTHITPRYNTLLRHVTTRPLQHITHITPNQIKQVIHGEYIHWWHHTKLLQLL